MHQKKFPIKAGFKLMPVVATELEKPTLLLIQRINSLTQTVRQSEINFCQEG